MATARKPKAVKLTVDAWPGLVEALSKQTFLGDTPEQVARYLIVEGLEVRQRASEISRWARNMAVGTGWRGPT